jgi:hypothetical protein
MAIIVALMAMLMMSVLGAALVLTTSFETAIAANFRYAHEGLYAAEAAAELALDHLAAMADWNPILEGVAQSAFVDGPPGGVRTLADGSLLDLGGTVNMLNCRKATGCTPSELVGNTAQRPWGPNNPVWRLFVYGPLSDLLGTHAVDSLHYVMVLAADDPSENDGNPLRDGDDETNAGSGVLALRAEAFGPRGARQAIELTVARQPPASGQTGLRLLAWRHIKKASG